MCVYIVHAQLHAAPLQGRAIMKYSVHNMCSDTCMNVYPILMYSDMHQWLLRVVCVSNMWWTGSEVVLLMELLC
jgi:hypothetical protein